MFANPPVHYMHTEKITLIRNATKSSRGVNIYANPFQFHCKMCKSLMGENTYARRPMLCRLEEKQAPSHHKKRLKDYHLSQSPQTSEYTGHVCGCRRTAQEA